MQGGLFEKSSPCTPSKTFAQWGTALGAEFFLTKSGWYDIIEPGRFLSIRYILDFLLSDSVPVLLIINC